MTDTLFRRIVLPVASEADAKASVASALSRLRDTGRKVIAVHVVEKAGGAPDKASVEQREQRARDIFAAVEAALAGTGIDLETEILYGTDVAETILDAADESDASAVVFTPRGGSRWVKLFTGDTASELIDAADRPVVVLPDVGDEDDEDDEDDEEDPENEAEEGEEDGG